MFTRRNLLIVNGVWALVLVIAGLSTAMSFVKKPEAAQVVQQAKFEEVVEEVAARPPLEDYAVITSNNFFDADLIPPPPPKEKVPPAPLKWKLKGTQRLGGKWTAYVELTTSKAPTVAPKTRRGRKRAPKVTTKKETIAIEVGTVILEYNVEILEIGKGYVKYQRTHDGEKLIPDYLNLNAISDALLTTKKTYDALIKPIPGKRNEFNVSRSELAKEVPAVSQIIKIMELGAREAPSAKDKNGGVEIIKAENQELLAAFGLAEEDVIVKINDQEIDAEAKLLEYINSIGDQIVVTLEIRRGKSKINLKYNLTR
jgi:hypothetical protein